MRARFSLLYDLDTVLIRYTGPRSIIKRLRPGRPCEYVLRRRLQKYEQVAILLDTCPHLLFVAENGFRLKVATSMTALRYRLSQAVRQFGYTNRSATGPIMEDC